MRPSYWPTLIIVMAVTSVGCDELGPQPNPVEQTNPEQQSYDPGVPTPAQPNPQPTAPPDGSGAFLEEPRFNPAYQAPPPSRTPSAAAEAVAEVPPLPVSDPAAMVTDVEGLTGATVDGQLGAAEDSLAPVEPNAGPVDLQTLPDAVLRDP